MEQGNKGPYFVRENVYPQNVAKDKFDQALAAGIRLLETFKPDYVDGSGTLVGVQVDGELKETVVPLFLDQQPCQRYSPNLIGRRMTYGTDRVSQPTIGTKEAS